MASASGSIGELTFRQTRQGLVLQQKSHPNPAITPAGEATKDRFRIAMNLFAFLNPNLRPRVTRAAQIQGRTVMQDWVSAYYKFRRYFTWNMALYDGVTPPLVIFQTVFHLPTMHFVTNLDTPAGTYHASIQRTINGTHFSSPTAFNDYPLTDPPTDLAIDPIGAFLNYLVFPFDPTIPLSLGKSDARLGVAP